MFLRIPGILLAVFVSEIAFCQENGNVYVDDSRKPSVFHRARSG